MNLIFFYKKEIKFWYNFKFSLLLHVKENIMNHYETVFILNPVLSDTQTEEAAKKYESLIVSQKAKSFIKKTGDLRS